MLKWQPDSLFIPFFTMTNLLTRVFLSCLVYLLSQVSLAFSVGVSTTSYTDPVRHRTLSTLVFYPSNSTEKPQLIERNKVFVGYEAIINPPIAEGRFPLVIMAHGSGGNHTSQAFLAQALASQGMIVVAANHPGSTTGDSQPQQGAQAWLQVEDLSFLLNRTLKSPQLAPHIDTQSIGAIGHSKGAYSVLALAGAQLSKNKTVTLCQALPANRNCAFYLAGKVRFETLDQAKYEASYLDSRFHYVVALDPGYASPPAYQSAYQNNSLANINTPVLLVGAPQFSPTETSINSDYLATLFNPQYLTYYPLQGATHFSFIGACTTLGAKVLAEEGEPFVCQDDSRNRQEVQRELTQVIIDFIRKVKANK